MGMYTVFKAVAGDGGGGDATGDVTEAQNSPVVHTTPHFLSLTIKLRQLNLTVKNMDFGVSLPKI